MNAGDTSSKSTEVNDMHTQSIMFSQDCSGQFRTTEAKCQGNNTRDMEDDGSFKSMFRYRSGLLLR